MANRNVRRFMFAGMMIAFLPVSAYAQQDKGPPTARTQSEMKNDAAIDSAYKRAMKNTDDNSKKAAKTDPWQTIRPADGDNTKH